MASEKANINAREKIMKCKKQIAKIKIRIVRP